MSLHVVVIVGPTACGKTRLAVEVAHRIGSEILSADSRQVYRGLDLGAGKDLGEYSRVTPPVPYHLIDVVEPEEVYTIYQYQQDCYRVLRAKAEEEKFGSGATPLILVGGSGLYVEAVVRDFRIADVPRNRELRARLAGRGRQELVAELERKAPALFAETDLSSARRVIRALEVADFAIRGCERASGRASRTVRKRTSVPPGVNLRFTVFGVTVERRTLRGRIGLRLRRRIEEGMVEEVRGLLERGLSIGRLSELGLEYRELGKFLLGRKSLDEAVGDLELAIGRFAKRQETWFRGMERRGVPIRWIDPEDTRAVLSACGANSGPPPASMAQGSTTSGR